MLTKVVPFLLTLLPDEKTATYIRKCILTYLIGRFIALIDGAVDTFKGYKVFFH